MIFFPSGDHVRITLWLLAFREKRPGSAAIR